MAGRQMDQASDQPAPIPIRLSHMTRLDVWCLVSMPGSLHRHTFRQCLTDVQDLVMVIVDRHTTTRLADTSSVEENVELLVW